MHIDSSPDSDLRPYGRRAFLAVMAGGLSSLLWARPVWRLLSPATDVLPSSVRQVFPSGWRIYTVAATMPRFDPATWRLRIDGLVERPLELSYRELRALPRAEQVSDFHCVTGWSVKNVRWAGVRFHDLLAQARPLPRAGALTFVSAEKPYVDSLALDQASLKDALLAYEMDGPAAVASTWRAGPRRDPGDVRLQERQVGRADRRQRTAQRRLLGGARL